MTPLTTVLLDLLAQGPALLASISTLLPELVAAAKTELALFTSGAAPTAAQQAAIDAALDKAHAALQA